MHISDYLKNSPLRTFDKAIGGTLGNGNLGVIVSKKGIGKTALVVHLAIDKMLQGKNIVHVAFSNNVEDVSLWYREIFTQVSNEVQMKDTLSTYESMLSKRTIMNFAKDMPLKNVLSSLDALITNALKADAVFFDSFSLEMAKEDDIKAIKDFAKKLKVETWFAVSPIEKDVKINQYGVPSSIEPYEKDIDVLVALKMDDETKKVKMSVIKTPESNKTEVLSVTLNPQTMLIEE